MEAEPLDPQELHAFTDSMLPGCFHLLDELPDTVYRLCDLLMTAIKRSGPEYRDLILGQVVHQVRGPTRRKCRRSVFVFFVFLVETLALFLLLVTAILSCVVGFVSVCRCGMRPVCSLKQRSP